MIWGSSNVGRHPQKNQTDWTQRRSQKFASTSPNSPAKRTSFNAVPSLAVANAAYTGQTSPGWESHLHLRRR